jgi:hypothetical protein
VSKQQNKANRQLLQRAASAPVEVADTGESWMVMLDGEPNAAFPKRLYAKFIAQTYADGLALRVASRGGGS